MYKMDDQRIRALLADLMSWRFETPQSGQVLDEIADRAAHEFGEGILYDLVVDPEARRNQLISRIEDRWG